MENLSVVEDFNDTDFTFIDGDEHEEISLVSLEDQPIENIEKIHYFKNTVHFKRRRHDRLYEIIGLSSGRPDHLQNSDITGNRWVCLSVVSTHDEALKEIKRLRT